jgi:hypothetical protein
VQDAERVGQRLFPLQATQLDDGPKVLLPGSPPCWPQRQVSILEDRQFPPKLLPLFPADAVLGRPLLRHVFKTGGDDFDPAAVDVHHGGRGGPRQLQDELQTPIRLGARAAHGGAVEGFQAGQVSGSWLTAKAARDDHEQSSEGRCLTSLSGPDWGG